LTVAGTSIVSLSIRLLLGRRCAMSNNTSEQIKPVYTAVEFFEALRYHSDIGAPVYLRGIHKADSSVRTSTVESALSFKCWADWDTEITKRLSAERNKYFVVNIGGTKAQQMKAPVAVIFEMDHGTQEMQMDAIRSIGAVIGEPSALVWTGGKSYHAYWFLWADETTPESEWQDWRSCVHSLAVGWGGDMSLSDRDQIMRVPDCDYIGADGKPTGGRSVVTLLEPKRVYFLEDIKAGLEAAGMFQRCDRPERWNATNRPDITGGFIAVAEDFELSKEQRAWDHIAKGYRVTPDGCTCGDPKCWSNREEVARDLAASFFVYPVARAEAMFEAIDRQLCDPSNMADRPGRFREKLESAQQNLTPYERKPVTAPQRPVVIEELPDDDAVDGGLTSETLGDLIDPVSDEQYELIRGLHRKMLGMLHSPDGLGKTIYMLYGTFCQIVRKDFSDFTAVNPHPSDTLRVLYVETEDGREEAIDRMQKLIGGTYQRRLADGTIKTVTYNNTNFDGFEQEQIKRQVRIISEGKLTGAKAGTYEQLDLTNPRHMTALRMEIREHQIDLVIIDVMKQAFAAVDENNNTDMQTKVINPLKAVVQQEDCAALIIHHSNGEGKARGASSVRGAVRYRRKLTQLMEPDPDNPEQKIPRMDGAFRAILEKDKRSIQKRNEYLRINSAEDGSLTVVIEDPSTVKIHSPKTSDIHAEKVYNYLLTTGETLGAREIKSGTGLTDYQWKACIGALREMRGVEVKTINGNEAYRLGQAHNPDSNH
jgi:RecA-family ATPase